MLSTGWNSSWAYQTDNRECSAGFRRDYWNRRLRWLFSLWMLAYDATLHITAEQPHIPQPRPGDSCVSRTDITICRVISERPNNACSDAPSQATRNILVRPRKHDKIANTSDGNHWSSSRKTVEFCDQVLFCRQKQPQGSSSNFQQAWQGPWKVILAWPLATHVKGNLFEWTDTDFLFQTHNAARGLSFASSDVEWN